MPSLPRHGSARVWCAAGFLLVLLALRLPAFVEPAGNDQNLYMYTADVIRDGGVPYLDAWDQKPPGVFFVYAAVRAFWPYPSATALGDLVAAAGVALLLLHLGRRTVGDAAGWLAASTFLLLGHPSIARLSGIYLRGQCETFVALCIVGGVVLAWDAQGRTRRLLLAGVCLGLSVWLKYNTVTYALPIALTVWLRAPGSRLVRLVQLMAVAAGAILVSAVCLGYLASHGALHEWRLATIAYNLRYSGETYQGPLDALTHVLALPIGRARVDLLWFLGGVGMLLSARLAWRTPAGPLVGVTATWLAAAVVSIAINGARDLPQYFVQANPALAMAAATGLVLAVRRRGAWTALAVVVLALGLWRVGVESDDRVRLGGLPQLARNMRADLAYAAGRVDREAFLERFRGVQKHDAVEIDALTRYVSTTTRPDETIFVFGFSPAVYVDSGRRSASRFFWSRPITLEFAAEEDGYGPGGLQRELARARPVVVALQKQDWAPVGENSLEYFQRTPVLQDWLRAEYEIAWDTPAFLVWRRRS